MSVALVPLAIFAASQVGTPCPANMALMATGARFGFRRALHFVADVALGKLRPRSIFQKMGCAEVEVVDRTHKITSAIRRQQIMKLTAKAWSARQ